MTHLRNSHSFYSTVPFLLFSLTFVLLPGGSVYALGGSTLDIPRDVIWRGPDGTLLPFDQEEEILEYLRTAELVSWKRLREGVNSSRKVLLEKDGVQLHAIFREVSVFERKMVLSNSVQFNFRDDAAFEVAAYKLARKLGLDNVPPTVSRKLFGTRGSLQLWIENATSEKQRIRRGLLPDDIQLWRLQVQTLRFFDNLIDNTDRNQGNILFDPDWRMWMVDHTRAFRRDKSLRCPHTLKQIDRQVWLALQNLDDDWIRRELKEYLHGAELKALIYRKQALLHLVEGLIQEHGEELVLFDHSLLYTMGSGSLLPPRES